MSKKISIRTLFAALVLTLSMTTVSAAAPDLNTIPSSFAVPVGQTSVRSVMFQLTGIAPDAPQTFTSPQGTFSANDTIIGYDYVPLSIVVSGNGSVFETLTIPADIIQKALAIGTNIIHYNRTFTGPGPTSLSSLSQINLTTEAGADFQIKRIELYFDNNRADITVERNTPDLTAYANIRYIGTGVLQGYWEVDGRALNFVNETLTYAGSINIQSPKIPSLPTFDEGTHEVKLIITNPVTGIPVPSIVYFVTPGDYVERHAGIKLVAPEDGALMPEKSKFEWSTAAKASRYLVQFFENPESKPIFSAYTKSNSYELPDYVTKNVMTAGSSYFWEVTAFDNENSAIGKSPSWKFKLK